jgi:hypothetical protein
VLPIPLRAALAQKPREIAAAEHLGISSGYVRDTLGRGLAIRGEVRRTGSVGVNPFRYGFVGSTDTHAGRAGDVEERNWQGAIGTVDESLELRTNRPGYANYNPGGLTGIWASQNTRADLFAALQRRETFATSGPRIRLRFDQSIKPGRQCGDLGRNSVPMGSSLGGARSRRAPTFTVQALKDDVPLQRVDIIKLVMRGGELQQSIRSWQAGSRGKAEWCVAWRDDDYLRDEPALWYARVLQVPTQRWDGKRDIRERAWSSPIWALPEP